MDCEALLSVCDLRVSAGATEVVRGIDFELAPGESLGVVGASGCGKSMTTLALLGLLPEGVSQSGGEICFGGESLGDLGNRAWRKVRGARIGLVFQDPSAALNPVLRIGFQVEEVLAAHGVGGVSRKERRQRVLELFHEVQLPEPERLIDRFPHELSGGERQRVMIAIALAAEPELLLADEPTTALDVTVQAAILELVARIRVERGLAMLWISHDLGVIAQVCDRVLVMDQGQIVEQGAVLEVLRAPRSVAAQRLLAALPQAARGGGFSSASKLSAHVSADSEAHPVLRVEQLNVRYPAERDWLGRVRSWTTAVDQVSLNVPAGGTLALVGESGSGKSSLGRAVLRLVASTGSIELQPSGSPPMRLDKLEGAALRGARKQMGVVFQDPARSLNPRLKIGVSVTEPLRIHRSCSRFELFAEARRLLEMVDLDPSMADRFPAEMSGGQKQRVAIARALALNPSLVICDEAVSALDVAVQKTVLELLQRLQSERGTGYLFITHDLAVVEDFADEVAVMRDGCLVEQGRVAQVFACPEHAYTAELLAASPRVPALS
ncbi:MAG: ABC transporter ATP-binding protein [Planctomycetes bacterium]|nr:ABC transporter ATP-binding protein [Planctomycetota bacterium]